MNGLNLHITIRKIFSLFMAFYIFNFSIDSRDASPDHIAEDLSFNDVESFYEFILEDLVGIENAVEERDERDEDDGGSFQFKKFCFTSLTSTIQVKSGDYIFKLYIPKRNCPGLANRYGEIDSPPPRA